MIAITNRMPVKEGAAEQIVERFAGSGGAVQDFPGFVAMQVLRSSDDSEVLVVTWWKDRESFDSWVNSEAFGEAHGGEGRGGDAAQLLSGRPQMGSYEVAVERGSSSG